METATQMEALQQIGFLWIHEISHILREHGQRAAEGAVDPNIWNIAADMEINDSHWEGLEAPALYPGIYPKTFRMNPGELAETYYKKLTEKSEKEIQKGLAKAMDKILEEAEKEKAENKEDPDQPDENSDNQKETDPSSESDNGEEEQNPDSPTSEDKNGEEQESENGNGGGNDPNSDGSENKTDQEGNPDNGEDPENSNNVEGPGTMDDDGSKSDNPDNKRDDDRQNSEGSGNEQDKDPEDAPGSGEEKDPNAAYHDLLDEGSGVHNVARPWELESGETEPQELDDIETEQIRIAVAKEMSEAQKAGLLPAGWERWVGNKLRPVVDWRKVLRHRVSRAINHSVGARIDYSFARPSRRQAVYQPLIPPALSGNLTGQIACVVDTSGSIDDVQLTRILSEVCGILEVFNTPVTIIPCDAKPYPPVVLTRSTDLRQITSMPGGGGTNMIRGIEAALELKPAPDVVVVLTDGYTPYPEKLYKTPVLFGIITNDLERTSMLPGSPWRDDLVVKILLKSNI